MPWSHPRLWSVWNKKQNDTNENELKRKRNEKYVPVSAGKTCVALPCCHSRMYGHQYVTSQSHEREGRVTCIETFSPQLANMKPSFKGNVLVV